MSAKREKALPVIIAECLKAGAQVALRIDEIEASLTAALATQNPSPKAECEEQQNVSCEYVQKLRELFIILHHADDKAQELLDRLEV